MATKAEIKSLNERALQTTQPPAYDSTEEVRVRGEELAEPIYWQGRQWAITSYGIEARDGTYHIAGNCACLDASRHGWIEHMAEKEWVDLSDFTEALRLARGRWPRAAS